MLDDNKGQAVRESSGSGLNNFMNLLETFCSLAVCEGENACIHHVQKVY